MHIMEGLGDPFKQPLKQLHYVLRGVKRCENERGMNTRERLPISPEFHWRSYVRSRASTASHVVDSMLFSLFRLPASQGTNGPRG